MIERGSELDLSLIVWRCYISNFRVLALILPDFSRFPHEWGRSDCVSKVVSHPTCRAWSLAWRVVEQKKWPSDFFLKGGESAAIAPPPPAPWKICELCYYCHLLRKTYRERLLPSVALFIDQLFPGANKSCGWHKSLSASSFLGSTCDEKEGLSWVA